MIATSIYEFDAETHTYRIGGRVVPGVTGIIKETVGVSWEADQWYLTRGQAVHAAAALIAKGKSFTCDPRIEGFVAALRAWFAFYRPVVLMVEEQVYSERHLYGGTLDLLCTLPDYAKLGAVMVDWKNSLDEDRAAMQMGAYSLCNHGKPVRWGFGVELHEDCTYRMSKQMDLRRASNDFLNLRSTYSIRERLGVLNKGEHDNAKRRDG